MGQIKVRPEVWDDVRELATHYSGRGIAGSEDFAKSVITTFRELAAMPGMGSLKFFRSRRLEGLRSWWVKPYRKILVLYWPIEDGIEVLAVMHGARNLRSHLLRRLRK